MLPDISSRECVSRDIVNKHLKVQRIRNNFFNPNYLHRRKEACKSMHIQPSPVK